MRIPQQVSERVKEAPAQALRAVFSGIGQVLLVADRIKSRAAEPTRAQPGAAERRGQPGQKAAGGVLGGRPPRTSTAAEPRDEARWRSLDETGNVRLLSDEDAPESAPDAGPAADTEAAAAEVPASGEPPAPGATAGTEPAAAGPPVEPEPVVLAEAGAGPEQAALPLPNYDDLSLASLRARLRNLDTGQVRALLDYEKANAGRAAVLTMFERRIEKLESLEA